MRKQQWMMIIMVCEEKKCDTLTQDIFLLNIFNILIIHTVKS